MEGKGGDDTYVVDNAGDQVIEGSGLGQDRVESVYSYTLGGYVEDLTLTGGNVSGRGNALDNRLQAAAATMASTARAARILFTAASATTA